MTDHLALRPLGNTDILVSPVAMGCWPIAGMTSLHVNDRDSEATLAAALDSGINFFDTAYSYGANGESERLIAKVLVPQREKVVIASKGGLCWKDGERFLDAKPETLRRQCEESLQRLSTDYVDLLYLHAPDPATPITESAGELLALLQAGKTRSVGVSNVTPQQLQDFASVCPVTAVQPPYNMLQRQVVNELQPWLTEHSVANVPYWPLMKGLLAGKLTRDTVFEEGDGRRKYPMFFGEEWEKNQDFLDELRTMAGDLGKSVADLVINWTISQPGITSVLCGAKRPQQIRESAAAMSWRLSPEQLATIDAAIERRGTVVTKQAL